MRKIKNKTFLVITLLFFIGIVKKGKDFCQVYKQLKFYENEIKRLKKENELLADKIEKIKTNPFYIEKILRENYGMIKEGEYIIKIGD
ncbi:MAG: septum formation initiator family protein [Candidatus Omnitrophica bacterium]|nr:septum formation initiator family protein [Candidatus Omnitrophota bacterium]